MMRYWIKLLTSNDSFIPKKIYHILKMDVDNNKNYNGAKWAFQIKCILDSIGLSNLWMQQFDTDIPFNLINQRLLDIYKQTWYASVNNSNRLLTYARYKHDFNFETYLDAITEKKYRIALSQFQLSSHDLEIERGRFVNVNRDERTCRFCNGNHIKNEYHFLFVCPLYRDIRKTYLKPYYCQWPTLNKFDDIQQNRCA